MANRPQKWGCYSKATCHFADMVCLGWAIPLLTVSFRFLHRLTRHANMDVSVFGTGYVGLIQAAALADVGHRILCVDIDPNKIKQLQQAVPPISEPGLSGTLEENIKASDAVEHANAPVICTELKNFRV